MYHKSETLPAYIKQSNYNYSVLIISKVRPPEICHWRIIIAVSYKIELSCYNKINLEEGHHKITLFLISILNRFQSFII